MALSYNLGYQEIISVHPTSGQIFAGNPDSTFPNIWQWVISISFINPSHKKKLASLDRVKWINLVRNGGSFEKLILWVVRTLGVTLDGKSYYPNIKFPKPHIFLPPIVMRFQLSSSLVGISLGFFPPKEWCNECFLDKGMVQKTKWKF